MASSLGKFYAGRTLFLTGGSGYVGKQIIEKLLRSCPTIDQINILMRPKKNMSPDERLDQLLLSPVFDRLKEENPNFRRKIVTVPGDTLLPGLGISDTDHSRLTSNVSIILHCAASLNFIEPLRNAVRSNVISTQRALTLARDTKHIEAFVHVSTAYSQIDKKHISEQVYDAPIEPNRLLSMIELLSDEELAELTPRLIGARPNVYTLTKAVAEKLVDEQRGNVPVAIIRPSIVTASLAEPVTGWVDNYSAGNGLLVGAGMGMVNRIKGRKECLVDFVPVDLTANAIIATAWHTALNRKSQQMAVYNFTSGNENPLTLRNVYTCITYESRRHPTSQRTGRPNFSVAPFWFVRQFDMHLLLPLRAKLIDMIMITLGKSPRAMKTQSKFSQLQEVLEYFTTNDWHWDTDNVVNMKNSLNSEDLQEFNFDLSSFKWSEYMTDYWRGMRKYLLKDPIKEVEHSSSTTTTELSPDLRHK